MIHIIGSNLVTGYRPSTVGDYIVYLRVSDDGNGYVGYTINPKRPYRSNVVCIRRKTSIEKYYPKREPWSCEPYISPKMGYEEARRLEVMIYDTLIASGFHMCQYKPSINISPFKIIV